MTFFFTVKQKNLPLTAFICIEGGENTLEKLLDVSAVADLLGIEKISVYNLVYRNQIPCVKLSRRMLRFRASDIAEWIALKVHEPHVIQQRGKKTPVYKPKFVGQSSIDGINAIVRRAKSEVLEAKK